MQLPCGECLFPDGREEREGRGIDGELIGGGLKGGRGRDMRRRLQI